jgi:hypothetical protein
MRRNALHIACLQRAAKLSGGYGPLATRLGLSAGFLKRLANGERAMETIVFLELVDILAEQDTLAILSGRSSECARNEPPKCA